MVFDIRTLLVATGLATAFCAAGRVLLWRMHPAVPGLGRWAAASVLGAVSLILIATKGFLTEAVSLSLAQVMIAIGFVVGWDGFRRFLGREPLTRRELWGLVLVSAAATCGAHLAHSMALRVVVNSTVVGSMSALIARELLAGSTQAAVRATGWIYAANAAFFVVRTGPMLGVQSPTEQLPAYSLLWWLCMTVAITLGMALMTSQHLQRELDDQASRDPLTGALNRRAFAMMAEKEVARLDRGGRAPSLLMMDLDHFKQINDRLGHGVGDQVLRRFVAVAARVLRAEDVFCRFGGEEFVALLPDTVGAQALAAAERLRVAFTEEAARDASSGLPFAFTVSIGAAEMVAGEGVEALIRRADQALYRAKAAGRNRCELDQGAFDAESRAASTSS